MERAMHYLMLTYTPNRSLLFHKIARWVISGGHLFPIEQNMLQRLSNKKNAERYDDTTALLTYLWDNYIQ